MSVFQYLSTEAKFLLGLNRFKPLEWERRVIARKNVTLFVNLRNVDVNVG